MYLERTYVDERILCCGVSLLLHRDTSSGLCLFGSSTHRLPALSYIGNKERERFIIVCKLKDLARAMAEDFAYDLKRYKKLYG